MNLLFDTVYFTVSNSFLYSIIVNPKPTKSFGLFI